MHCTRCHGDVDTDCAQVEDQDFTDVHIIAFRRMNQMDISGNVITAEEYLASLKVWDFCIGGVCQRQLHLREGVSHSCLAPSQRIRLCLFYPVLF